MLVNLLFNGSLQKQRMFDLIEVRAIPIDWGSKQFTNTWRKPTTRDITKTYNQRQKKRTWKSGIQSSLNIDKGYLSQRPIWSELFTNWVAHCSLITVLLTFFFEHLVSVSGIFFDCSTYYFANHSPNYKFCCIPILACLTRKTSLCESALLFIQNGLFQAFR